MNKVLTTASVLALAMGGTANAEPAPAPTVAASADAASINQEIIVTAQRRSESINRVPMSIDAVSHDLLLQAGVGSPEDLVKLVPGLIAADTKRGAPTYYIRGVGFDESTLGANPAVALYNDEVPLAYPAYARLATFDLERVEVLKGPQGLLYGQNSTGGAINFIAAKPTPDLEAGMESSIARFGLFTAQGFVSGPLTPTLRVRLAGMVTSGGAWQQSYTRAATLGDKDQLAGRLIADWTPTDRLRFEATVNAWSDRSQSTAVQFIGTSFDIPPAAVAALSAYPVAPANARAADWDPSVDYRHHDHMVQMALRSEYDLSDTTKLTALTSYVVFKERYNIDADGTALQNFLEGVNNSSHSFAQELRLHGHVGRAQWLVGANYTNDVPHDLFNGYFAQSSANLALGYPDAVSYSDQRAHSLAAFGNVDVDLTEHLMLHTGLRYTNDHRSSSACAADAGDGKLAAVFSGVASAINGRTIVIPPGGCVTLRADNTPGLINNTLQEDNVSWRVGLDYKPDNKTLIYGSISKGFKSGAFPNINAGSYVQYGAVPQESVLAVELGTKLSLLDRKLQVNAATFYDDYRNKQLQGRVLDPLGIFGALDKLVSIPKSRIWGAELELVARPVRALTLTGNVSYVDTKVLGSYTNYDPFGNLIPISGLAFPHTPRWTATVRADYRTAISDSRDVFAGLDSNMQSSTQGVFNRPEVTAQQAEDPVNQPGKTFAANTFLIPAFAVVDAQIGLAGGKDRWKVWLWGKNILNKYALSNAYMALETAVRSAQMPVTYGLSASIRF